MDLALINLILNIFILIAMMLLLIMFWLFYREGR